MRICVGQIQSPHGVKGLVKLASFTADPGDILRYGTLTDEAGTRSFDIALLSAQDGRWLARIAGITDRDAAQALAGTRLFVDRVQLPEPEDEEFYHADLIGLRVELADGAVVGRVAALHDFGAGEMVEVEMPTGKRPLLPFTKAVVPVVDLAGGRLVVDPPPGLLEAEGR